MASVTGNYSCGEGEGKSSLPDRRWKCARCSATFDDNVILFNCGCQSCGSSQLEIVRLKDSAPSSSSSTTSTTHQQHTPPLLRTPSTEVADLINVSRTLARQALTFAGGDVNEACRNLLLCTLDPSGDPPFLVLAKSELSTMGGISKEEAEALLIRCNNDVNLCKQELMKGIFDEEILWDVEGREVVKPRVQRNTTVIDCVVCYGSIPVGEAIVLGQCAHVFCTDCLQAHVTTCTSEGKTLIVCPSQCGAEVTQAELREVVGLEHFNTIDRKQMEAAVAIDPTLHHCPTPDCSNIVCWTGEEDGVPLCNCLVCNKKSCLVCGVSPYHNGMTCDEYIHSNTSMSESDKAANEQAFQQYMQNSNIRVCGRCKNAVVKSSGCNKMKCRCGFRFCYVCGSENAQCGHTPASHGFIDNVSGRGDFSHLREAKSAT